MSGEACFSGQVFTGGAEGGFDSVDHLRSAILSSGRTDISKLRKTLKYALTTDFTKTTTDRVPPDAEAAIKQFVQVISPDGAVSTAAIDAAGEAGLVAMARLLLEVAAGEQQPGHMPVKFKGFVMAQIRKLAATKVKNAAQRSAREQEAARNEYQRIIERIDAEERRKQAKWNAWL